jgi:hypothetical protein
VYATTVTGFGQELANFISRQCCSIKIDSH